jgi:hypothetical protein
MDVIGVYVKRGFFTMFARDLFCRQIIITAFNKCPERIDPNTLTILAN